MPLLPVLATLLVALMHPGLAHADRWSQPLSGAVVTREFDFDARAPFVHGAHRGVRLAGRAGDVVRAPCGGTVVFAGALPRLGTGVSLRCRRLVATEFGLERLSVRRGAVLAPGSPVGRLAASGSLYLGARVAARRWGYRDPLALITRPAPGRPLGPAPRPPRRGSRPWRTSPRPPTAWAGRATRSAAPLTAWLGLALAGIGAGLGTTLGVRAHRTRAARGAQATGGSHGTH
jgi:Peptidase family M23